MVMGQDCPGLEGPSELPGIATLRKSAEFSRVPWEVPPRRSSGTASKVKQLVPGVHRTVKKAEGHPCGAVDG